MAFIARKKNEKKISLTLWHREHREHVSPVASTSTSSTSTTPPFHSCYVGLIWNVEKPRVFVLCFVLVFVIVCVWCLCLGLFVCCFFYCCGLSPKVCGFAPDCALIAPFMRVLMRDESFVFVNCVHTKIDWSVGDLSCSTNIWHFTDGSVNLWNIVNQWQTQNRPTYITHATNSKRDHRTSSNTSQTTTNNNNMYPWYRESQIGVGQFCGPMSATIKTESGYNDCMLALDYAAQSKVNETQTNSRRVLTTMGIQCFRAALIGHTQHIFTYFWQRAYELKVGWLDKMCQTHVGLGAWSWCGNNNSRRAAQRMLFAGLEQTQTAFNWTHFPRTSASQPDT